MSVMLFDCIEDQKARRSFPRYNDGARAGSQVKLMLGGRAFARE
jgi:hypothetical protein